MVQALTGVFRAFDVAAAALIEDAVKTPGAGVLMDPAVDAAEVKLLPGLQLNGLALIHAADMMADAKPSVDPIRTCRVKHVREIVCALPLQITEMALACGDFRGAALVMQTAGDYLLGIDCRGMMQPGGAISHPQTDLRPDLPPSWQRHVFAPAGHGLAG